MAEGPIVPALLKLAIPIILANFLKTTYQITDAFWVGRLGAASVAAVSVTFPITFLMIAFGGGLGMAGVTLTAQYAGARNQSMLNHVAAQTMLMVLGVSLVLGLIGVTLAPQILQLTAVTREVYLEALGFMRVTFVGLVFVFSFAMFEALMRSVGQTLLPLYIVLGTVILNFMLDPLFIFGWGPIPASGVMGAAVATLATQGLAAVMAMVLLLRGTYGIKIAFRGLMPDLSYVKRVFLLGFPTSIELSAQAFGLVFMSFLIASFGTVTLAAYSIGSSVSQVVGIPALGFSAATASLVGRSIGAGQIERAARITALGAAIGFVGLSGMGLFAFVAAPGLVGFFIPKDHSVIAEGAIFIRIISPAWGFIAVQMTVISALRASGNTLASMTLTLVSLWALQFPMAYALSRPHLLGTLGLWWSFPTANVLASALACSWYLRRGWRVTRLTAEPLS
jgi:putative MATE family efflux protein